MDLQDRRAAGHAPWGLPAPRGPALSLKTGVLVKFHHQPQTRGAHSQCDRDHSHPLSRTHRKSRRLHYNTDIVFTKNVQV